MMTQMIRVALIVATTALLATAQTCHIHGALPDARCTPGAIRTTDARAICAPTFRTGPYRHTTASTKRRVTVCSSLKCSNSSGSKSLLSRISCSGAATPRTSTRCSSSATSCWNECN